MKTQFINNHLKEECENTGSYSFSLSALHSQSEQEHVRTLKRKWSAFLGWNAGLINSIKVAINEVTTNKRLFWGVVCLFGLAPLSWLVPYLGIFSPTAEQIPGYYYGNVAAYVFTIQFKVVLIFAFTGAFIAAPLRWNYKYGCVVIVALALASIVNETFFIGDYKDFYKMPALVTLVTTLIIVWAAFKFINYAVHRTYHTKAGNYARIIGIIEMDSNWSDKETTLKLLAKEYREYNNRI
jgi:hypothetical protein